MSGKVNYIMIIVTFSKLFLNFNVKKYFAATHLTYFIINTGILLGADGLKTGKHS
jgi:hypothetical protein